MKFINIDSSKSLDAFAQKCCGSLLRRIDTSGERYKFNLSLKSVAKKKDGSVKSFQVLGVIKIKNAKELRVSKKGSDPKAVVLEAVTALEKQVRRWSELNERSRKTIGTSLKPVHEFKMEVFR